MLMTEGRRLLDRISDRGPKIGACKSEYCRRAAEKEKRNTEKSRARDRVCPAFEKLWHPRVTDTRLRCSLVSSVHDAHKPALRDGKFLGIVPERLARALGANIVNIAYAYFAGGIGSFEMNTFAEAEKDLR